MQNLPRCVAERCVHSRLVSAGCRGCVDACPQGAWVLDDCALGLDTAVCDGCGLCRPACPEGAIDMAVPLWLIPEGEGISALATCPKSGAAEGEPMPGCLHAIGWQELLGLWRRGVGRLVVSSGDCAACSRDDGGLIRRLARLRRAQEAAGETPMVLEWIAPAAWRQRAQAARRLPSGTPVGRRGFLRALAGLGRGDDGMAPLLFGRESARFEPPGQRLRALAPTAPLPFVPEIDSSRCDGCDACIRGCPHGALGLEGTDGAFSYRITAEACTGCGLCIDLCERDAIVVNRWRRPGPGGLPLNRGLCRDCGIPFHEPAARPVAERCRICRCSDRLRRLYQVI